MEADFWKLVVACTLANMLTVWFLYSVYRLTKAEKAHQDEKPIWYGGMIVPLLFIAGSIWMLKTGG